MIVCMKKKVIVYIIFINYIEREYKDIVVIVKCCLLWKGCVVIRYLI